MAKVDLITLSGLTASDGSLIASGATIKFESVFQIGSLQIKVYPKIWRNRELFDDGFKNTEIDVGVLPDDITINDLTEEEYYTLTPQKLYEKVRNVLNGFYGDNIIELQIIT